MSTKGQCAKLLLIAMMLALGTTNCGPAAAPGQLPTPGPATSPFPLGTFTKDEEDPLGGHTNIFQADGSYIYQGHGRGATGTYSVTGDQIVFKDNYCGSVLGRYTWSFDGSVLSFRMLDDTCAARSGVLHLGMFRKETLVQPKTAD